MNKKTLLTLVGLLAINGSMLAQSFTKFIKSFLYYWIFKILFQCFSMLQ